MRHQRMRGYNVLWQPGIDHAGIATQTVVERQLKREGKTRHDLGREAFLERVWGVEATRAAGASLEQRSARLLGRLGPHEVHDGPGPVARGARGVRAAPRGRAHLPRDAAHQLDVEAQTVALRPRGRERRERQRASCSSSPIPSTDADASAGATELVVATTRPETMLGDTAVAVHPDDPRYRHLHGKKLRPSVLGPRDPDHHRRDPRRHELRHRRGEGDAGARLQRLRDRQAPRARGDQHPEPRRHDERRRRAVRRARPLPGAEGGEEGARQSSASRAARSRTS